MLGDLSVDDLKKLWTSVQLYREGFDRGKFTSRAGKAEMAWGKRIQEMIDRLISEKEQQGDPNCEQCHGAGCAQCNDAIYYEQQDAVEQAHRDRAYDRSRALSPFGEHS